MTKFSFLSPYPFKIAIFSHMLKPIPRVVMIEMQLFDI